MVHRLLMQGPALLSVAAVVASGAACGPGRGDSEAPGSADAAAADIGGPVTPERRTARPGPSARFGQAVNRVYGIKIPTGMVPAPGPARVVRFEGAQPLEQVVHLVKAQVRFKEEVREGEGYLLRFATAEQDAVRRALAVRMFRDRDRTVLDIWKEHAFKERLPETGAGAGAAHPPRRPGSIANDARFQAGRRERLREAMQIMRKLQGGEPLTDAERRSELFN